MSLNVLHKFLRYNCLSHLLSELKLVWDRFPQSAFGWSGLVLEKMILCDFSFFGIGTGTCLSGRWSKLLDVNLSPSFQQLEYLCSMWKWNFAVVFVSQQTHTCWAIVGQHWPHMHGMAQLLLLQLRKHHYYCALIKFQYLMTKHHSMVTSNLREKDLFEVHTQ